MGPQVTAGSADCHVLWCGAANCSIWQDPSVLPIQTCSKSHLVSYAQMENKTQTRSSFIAVDLRCTFEPRTCSRSLPVLRFPFAYMSANISPSAVQDNASCLLTLAVGASSYRHYGSRESIVCGDGGLDLEAKRPKPGWLLRLTS